MMLTGRHIVRDVTCKKCDTKLGWVYEFATEENQRYKEGRVILERALGTTYMIYNLESVRYHTLNGYGQLLPLSGGT